MNSKILKNFFFSIIFLCFVLNLIFAKPISLEIEVNKNEHIVFGDDYFIIFKESFNSREFYQEISTGFYVEKEELYKIQNSYSIEEAEKGFVIGGNINLKLKDVFTNKVLFLVETDNSQILSKVEFNEKTPVYLNPKPHEILLLDFNITNTGLLDEVYETHLENHICYEYAFKSKGFDVNRIKIEKGEIGELSLEVKLLESCPKKHLNITPKLIGEYGTHEIDYFIEFNKQYSGDYEYILKELVTNTKVGKEIKNSIQIKNKGEVPISNLKVHIEVPDSWKKEITPEQIDFLDKGKSILVDFSLFVPKGVDVKDYGVVVTVSSNGRKSPVTTYRVQIREKNSNIYLAIGLLIFFMGAMFLFFKKLGRR